MYINRLIRFCFWLFFYFILSAQVIQQAAINRNYHVHVFCQVCSYSVHLKCCKWVS